MEKFEQKTITINARRNGGIKIMLVRKPNNNYPTINNQQSDKVIIDGLMTAEDMVDLGTRAGANTLEELKRLYPHNPELEKRELELIDDSKLVEKLRIAGKDNDEKINAFYANQKLKDEVNKTRAEIQRLNKEYQKTHENNLIYEKDRKISELEEKIKELQKTAN